MTAMELLAAAKHYWKMCMAIVAACTLAAACVFGFVLKPQYEATSSIIVMDPSGSVSTTTLTTVVSDCVAQYGSAEGDSSIASSVGTGAKSQTVFITVEESSPEGAVRVANQAAQYAAEGAQDYFASLEERRQKVPAGDNNVVDGSDDPLLIQQQSERSYAFCDFIVKDATGASAAGVGVAKGTAIGFLLGFCVALCALVARLIRRTPVASKSSLEGMVVCAPVLQVAENGDGSDRLWAMLEFGVDASISSVALLPVDKANTEPLSNVLAAAARIDRQVPTPTFVACPAWCQSSAGAVSFHDADTTVVCVKRWGDSVRDVAATLNELSYMKVSVGAIALID